MSEWVKKCADVIGIKPKILFYTGKDMSSRQYFPFHDYNNVLSVEKIKHIYGTETSMEEGLKNHLNGFKNSKILLNLMN